AQYAVPGLTLTEFGPGQTRQQLRGVGSPGGASGTATVGYYLDEMPLNVTLGGSPPDIRLLDIERIEVLRGPQPTLYGEGSMGGTIRYITASPDLREFGSTFAGRWGAVEDGSSAYRVSGTINAPLIEDKLGVRVVAGYENLGGWIDAPASGRKDVNDARLTTYRGKLLFEPTDALSISLLALHQKQEQDYQNFTAKDRTTVTQFPTANDGRYDLVNLVGSYDFGPVTLLGTVGYFDREAESAFDITSPFIIDFFEQVLGVPPGSITLAGIAVAAQTRMWAQELRLSSNGGGPLNYTLGAYYRDPKSSQVSTTVTSPGTLPFDPFGGSSRDVSEAWAVFGDASYAFTDRFEALIGVRYFEDKRSDSNHAPRTFDTINPRINLSFKISEDGLLYFNAAKGFRSGGFNLPLPSPPFPVVPPNYQPEELFSYELGAKKQWLDRRLTTELAVYYNDWKDLQVATSGFVPVVIFTNTGAASGPGIDLSLTARATEHLTVSGTFGYNDMQYDVNSPDRRKGDPLDLVSARTASLALDYRRPLASGTQIRARADYQYTSGYTLTLRDFFPAQPITRSDERNVVNLRLGADFGMYEAYLFAENVTDDNGSLYPQVASLPEPILARPRTLGIEMTVKF
ncbi:MAG: TonB-dependent receptor, partial [Steroidobacteraceae bacterium]